MCLRSLNLGLIGFGRKSLSVAHPAPSLSMLSLDAGVLRGEERLRDRELGLPMSGELLTASWGALAGALEPDLAGGVGMAAFDFFPAVIGGVGGVEERFLLFVSFLVSLLDLRSMGIT